MLDESFAFTIPARSNGSESWEAASGPDMDAILRDVVRTYMREANQSPDDVANNLGIAKRELNRWLAGAPGTIDLLSRFVAAAGVQNCDQLFGGHPGWQKSGHPIATMKDMLVYRWSQLTDLDGVRIAIELRLLLARVPETFYFLRRGLKDALDYAEQKGVDVRSERLAIERGFRRVTENVQRAANGN
jgi:hypothetical protein